MPVMPATDTTVYEGMTAFQRNRSAASGGVLPRYPGAGCYRRRIRVSARLRWPT